MNFSTSYTKLQWSQELFIYFLFHNVLLTHLPRLTIRKGRNSFKCIRSNFDVFSSGKVVISPPQKNDLSSFIRDRLFLFYCYFILLFNGRSGFLNKIDNDFAKADGAMLAPQEWDHQNCRIRKTR